MIKIDERFMEFTEYEALAIVSAVLTECDKKKKVDRHDFEVAILAVCKAYDYLIDKIDALSEEVEDDSDDYIFSDEVRAYWAMRVRQ